MEVGQIQNSNFNRFKVIRTATIPLSLNVLLKGQLSYLNQFFSVIGLASSGSDLSLVSQREGVDVIEIDMERRISPIKDLKSLWLLYRCFKIEKPIIVHSITPKAGLLSMVAAKIAGVPIRIHTFTGLVFPTRSGFFKHLLIMMDRFLCRCATNVYPEGKGVLNDMKRFKITSKPLKILANGNINGVDVQYFDSHQVKESERLTLRNSLDLQDNDFIFLFVGRLVGDKGINELVSAFCELNVLKKSVKLLLVGPEEIELDPLGEDTLHKIKMNENIISVGYQSDVRLFFSIADVFVFPSYREGFPNVVLQAGSMGVPSIVTDISGSNEIIENEINGTIVPVRDVLTLRNVMELYINKSIDLSSLRINCRRIIVERYQNHSVWSAVNNEYRLLLNKNGYNV